ncbi:MAG TPA: type 1 glutamine amidotransferase [Patescibacteria group bacterium]|nr:type 1 glutamine amidotransferase [Patescibacteria group bacterium]
MSTKYQIPNTKYSLRIAWLYPDLMSTYGDRGNIIALQKRCEWRGINVEFVPITVDSNHKLLANCDLLFMGGGEDRQQKIVSDDFQKGNDKILRELIEKETPGLFICGAYQFLGKYYKEADGSIVNGLGILDIYTENPGIKTKRLIGNMAFACHPELVSGSSCHSRESGNLSEKIPDRVGDDNNIIGFENHGGRTYLGKNVQSLGKVLTGFGNNGEDQTEGAIYKNTIGSYSHGPILPKNPQLADWLISKALEIKYKKEISLEPLDDSLESQAKEAMLQRLKINH